MAINIKTIACLLLFVAAISANAERSMSAESVVAASKSGSPKTSEGARLFQLDELTVSSGLIRDEETTPNMTVVIPELLLQGSGSTLDAALIRQAGIDVRRPQEVGGALDDESIRIRGMGSSRIMLGIDGRTLNTPGTAGGYYIDWSSVPLYNVERIEVIKGVSDPRYGNVLGGVINLVTKKPSDKPVVEAQGLMGSFDTRTMSFLHSFKPNRFEYSVSGGYSQSSGYLWNGSFNEKNINIYAAYELPWDGKLKADVQYITLKKGFIVPNRISNNPDTADYSRPKNPDYPASDGELMFGGMGAYPGPGSWWKREKLYLNIGYEQKVLDGIATVRYWQNYSDREVYNVRESLNRVFHKRFFDDRSYGFDGSYVLYLDKHTLQFGIDYKNFKDKGDKNYPDDYRPAFVNDSYVSAALTGVYLMDDFAITNNLTITPGIRYMSYSGKAGPTGIAEGIRDLSMSGIAPSLKLTYRLSSEGLVYGSIARALRMPAPPEHYWHFSPDAGVDTSKLQFNKEEGAMLQGGVRVDLPSKTRIEASVYYYDIKDYIQFDLINFVSYNIDRARIYGIELEAAQQIGSGFSVFANYTFQQSRTSGDPFVAAFIAPEDRGFSKIPGMPEHKINMGLQYKGQNKAKITLYGRYISKQQVIYNNNSLFNTDLRVRNQDSYITADLEASYPLSKNIAVTAYCRNLFNAAYQERFGYQAAERNIGAGIKAVF